MRGVPSRFRKTTSPKRAPRFAPCLLTRSRAHRSLPTASVARLAIVNAPRGFAAIWNVMKPWIAKETAAKVSIMGSDYRARLLELVDADALPARLGGACTCEGLGG